MVFNEYENRRLYEHGKTRDKTQDKTQDSSILYTRIGGSYADVRTLVDFFLRGASSSFPLVCVFVAGVTFDLRKMADRRRRERNQFEPMLSII